ncbi:MAG TPA: methyltransferase [Phycisphaerae bacterium]|nr:methyltransferase [Phycisphaerae bacterium]
MPAPDAPSVPPHIQLIQMSTAHWVSQILYVAAKLNLADRLAAAPKTADELAPLTAAHAPSLYRLLRALANLGILTESSDHHFALTPLGQALQSSAPGAAHATILTMAGDWIRAAMSQLLYSVQTGKPGFDHAFGMPVFDWLAQHPEEASLFSQTMIGVHGAEPDAVAASYDFSPFNTLIDVGGATGNLLAAILARHPQPRGILFDLPHVVRDAPALLASKNLTDRISIHPGSFFDTIPLGADAYLLSHIIHDWSEEKALAILANVRNAMKPTAKLLLIEMVLPPGDTPHPGKMLDIMMLVGPGGQERTEPQYAALLAKARLRLTRVVPTQSAASIVEAAPAN